MKPLKNSVSITLDSNRLERLRELAEQDGHSLSQYIDIVLKKHVLALNEHGVNFQNEIKSLEQEIK